VVEITIWLRLGASSTRTLPKSIGTSAKEPPGPKASPPRPLRRIEIEPSEAALPSITTPGLNRRVTCCGDSTSVGAVPASPDT
jgi:hypothetical protein